ncbi:MAG: AraC family transcriptional regulator [Muribaculaceae bacterium]|nr:AraC family transcriptional regulator [Muribaculaceae bacterium]MBQ2400049.1 AraC family transcriptional regulator [Muribaculaceae bacterium]MBQ5696987.1 AraC family transcriptional regulator [Muribaculaceae bacterium]MBQ5724261.1 AraC family transcriptional regulator [Muribaculaceae bacterium]MBR5787879.1 AraC family transcriptional regulator [Muribaculaceae bacterium]
MHDISDFKSISLSDIVKVLNSSATFSDIVTLSSTELPVRSTAFPQRIDALVLVMCKAGEATITIDLQQYHLKKNMLLMVHPRNFIMDSSISDDFEVNMIFCSHKIIEEIMPRINDISPLLLLQRSSPMMELTDAEADGFNDFFTFLSNKLNGEHTAFLNRKVSSIVQALFYEIMDYASTRHNVELRRKSRKQEIMAKFVLAVSENFKSERQVSYYADRLCVSPKHLSAVAKELSGMTAGEWIERYVVMEAKMLLKSTNLSVQEISNRLNFSNQSFFGKYFKHQTGFSPSEYRNQAD